jgi:hypothetical protein
MPLGFGTTLRDQFDFDRLLGVSRCAFKELHSLNLKGSEKKGRSKICRDAQDDVEIRWLLSIISSRPTKPLSRLSLDVFR